MKFWEFTYHSPWWFCLFAIIPFLIVLRLFKKANKEIAIGHSGFSLFGTTNSLFIQFIIQYPVCIKIISFFFFDNCNGTSTTEIR